MSGHLTHTFLPYLLRATYEWLVDNNLSAYIEIDTLQSQVTAPSKYIENNRIVLDISPAAVNKLKITNEVMEFEARFGDKISPISAPLNAVTALFNPENGCGIKLQPTLQIALPMNPIPNAGKTGTTTPSKTKSKPQLTIVKKSKQK